MICLGFCYLPETHNLTVAFLLCSFYTHIRPVQVVSSLISNSVLTLHLFKFFLTLSSLLSIPPPPPPSLSLAGCFCSESVSWRLAVGLLQWWEVQLLDCSEPQEVMTSLTGKTQCLSSSDLPRGRSHLVYFIRL